MNFYHINFFYLLRYLNKTLIFFLAYKANIMHINVINVFARDVKFLFKSEKVMLVLWFLLRPTKSEAIMVEWTNGMPRISRLEWVRITSARSI
jgi:hypothetical protein